MSRRRPRRGRNRGPHAPLLLAALVTAAAGGCSRPAPPAATAPPPPDVLLLTVDTLRADHLSAWGYPRATSPVLDRLASEGVRFARAQAQWPKTAPSFASLFTATYPKDNGVVRRVGMPINCRLRLLAEELAPLGYQRHAVVANGALAREYYFDQGFESYLEVWKAEPTADGLEPTTARNVTDLALGRLDQLSDDRPLFLWVHYIDPHAPYRPAPAWRDHYQDDATFAADGRQVRVDRRAKRRFIGAIGRSQVLDRRTDAAFYVARYDAEIRYVDTEIGRLIEGLRARGRWDRTLTVMTSDHGESLGEHDYWFGHGMLPFQTCLHVPLMLRLPGVIPPAVDEAPVELLDVAPTVLELAGAELDDGRWGQGRSLVRRLRGEQAAPARPAFSEAGYASDGMWMSAVFDGRFKLVQARTWRDQSKLGRRGHELSLFDLERDPGERSEVSAEHPAELERLAAALASWRAAPRAAIRRDAAECEPRDTVDPRTEEQLRSLGYL